MAVDGAGNLLLADTDNQRIRVVAASTGTYYGQAMTGGDIYTVAGGGTDGLGDGGPATSAYLGYPEGLAVDGAGNLLIADTNNARIRVVAAHAGTFYGIAMTAGDIDTMAGNDKGGFSGDGGLATSAELASPSGVAVARGALVDGAGNLLIADYAAERIRMVAASTGTFYGKAMTARHIYTVAGTGMQGFSGDGGPATRADLFFPYGVAVDGPGNLLIADTYNNRVRVVAAHAGTFYGRAMTAGHIYTVAGTGTSGFSGDGGPATRADLAHPDGVAVDGAGNLVIADASNNRMRVVAAQHRHLLRPADDRRATSTPSPVAAQAASGDGGPATSAAARLPVRGGGGRRGEPADRRHRQRAGPGGGGQHRHLLRQFDDRRGHLHRRRHRHQGVLRRRRPGHQRRLNDPTGVAVDQRGQPAAHRHQQLPDPGGGGQHRHLLRPGDDRRGHLHRRRHRPPGVLRRRRPATSADLNTPSGVAVDGAGNLLIADTDNQRIREVAG